jgi:hypothetical protein
MSARYHAYGIALGDVWEVGSLIGRWCARCLALASLTAVQECSAETEAAPIRYLAELVGTDTDTKQAIRWLIALRWWFSHATCWPLP